MFFSVSVPVYNAEKYVDRCIQSIVDQEFDDYEIVLVDDGSSDKSLSICEAWRDKYPNLIRVIHKDNRGSLLTRRTCIEESKGSYLYIMDADDYIIDCNFLKKAKEKIEESKCDLLLFNATIGDSSQKYYKYPFYDNELFEGEERKKVYKIAIEGDSLNSLWTKIFHQSLVDRDIDYSTFSHVTNGTDMFQMIPILFSAKRILYWDKIAYYYQLSNNENSIVHRFKPTIFLSLREGLIRLSNYCKTLVEKDTSFQDAINLRMLKIASTSAFKIRMASQKDNTIVYNYIATIGDDYMFRSSYDKQLVNKLPRSRRIIIKMLYNRWYWALIISIRLLAKAGLL